MRKTTYATLLILISATLVYSIQAEKEWVKFTSPEGRLSVLLPNQPKLEVVTDAANEKLTHNRFSEFEDGYAFVIEYFDNIAISDPETYLDEARDGIVSAIHGSLTRENKITLDGYPGRELELSLTAGNVTAGKGTIVLGRTRIYAVGSSFYSMSYVWRKDIDQMKVANIGEKYFTSIKITASK